jgi:hypothetical protein
VGVSGVAEPPTAAVLAVVGDSRAVDTAEDSVAVDATPRTRKMKKMKSR